MKRFAKILLLLSVVLTLGSGLSFAYYICPGMCEQNNVCHICCDPCDACLIQGTFQCIDAYCPGCPNISPNPWKEYSETGS
jgi:hypothetical protein